MQQTDAFREAGRAPNERPATIAGFHDRLQDQMQHLPARLRQCATYLASHADSIAVSTVAELAAAAGVPPSALVRCCHAVGFAGFSDMQRLFRDNYAQSRPDYATRLADLRDAGTGTAPALLAQFVDAGHRSLDALAAGTAPEALTAAVAQLCAAQVIHVAGLRRAFPVASYLAYALEKMNIAVILHDGSGRLDQHAALRPGDALIAISFTPYSRETVDIATTAAARGLSVVVVTDRDTSPIAGLSPVPLLVPEVDFGAFRSLAAPLALAMALAVAVGSARATRPQTRPQTRPRTRTQ